MQKHLSLKHGVLTLLLMLGSCVGLYAQQEQRVTLNLKNVSLKEMFRAIEEQSTYRFSYRNNVVDDRADITVSKKNVAVSTVLTDVLPVEAMWTSSCAERPPSTTPLLCMSSTESLLMITCQPSCHRTM